MRRKKKSEEAAGEGWLVTFSDLMTLLLTFFVLILSMSSMTQNVLTQINTFMNPRNYLTDSGAGRMSDRMRLILQLLREPHLEKPQDKLKDLLFPNDILPDGMSKSTTKENLEVLQTPEGLVIVMTDKLLFNEGSYKLTRVAKKLLQSLGEVLHHTSADINISGYTDNETPDGTESLMELSGLRALAVLEYFLQNESVQPSRFSISGYGSDRPRELGNTNSARAHNRRVEILIKNEQWLGRYRG